VIETQWLPLCRPDITAEEISAVTSVLQSGWLTTGTVCRQFEQEFASYLGVRYAVAVNSGTAALHLALESTGCRQGDLVLVPALTFAATAEVVAHFGATPVLIDCERETLNMDVAAAASTIIALESGRKVPGVSVPGRLHAIIPVHYGGQMADVDAVTALSARYGLRVIEDAAHAFPAAAQAATGEWRSVGTTAEQTCFSFYANKTLTTGEGGMLVTDRAELAARVRRMSLHGISRDADQSFVSGSSWDYQILSPGFKYNLSDIAAAIGREQLKKATRLSQARSRIAAHYHHLLSDLEEIELPTTRADRRHSWHLYVLRLHLLRLCIDRNGFIEELKQVGIGSSVHWRPLHLHPYYRDVRGYRAADFPIASGEWERCISLPIFPAMTEGETERVARAVRAIVSRSRRPVQS
jgi:perosamine synthetase